MGVAEFLRDGLPPAALPAQVLLQTLDGAQRELTVGGLAVRDTGRMQDLDLEAGLAAVGRVQESLTRTRLWLACEVAQRGLHLGSGFTLGDWLQQRCPELEAPVVRDLARLAQARREPVHAPLVDAALQGGMRPDRAARIHRASQRVQGALTPQQHQQTVELLTEAGCQEVFDADDVQRVIDEVLRRCLPERQHEDRARARRELRDLHESSLADGSVRRLIMTFGDDADYEAVRAIITSPLAAPASTEEQQATGQIETRTPGQRRYDALMTVVIRGVAGSREQPVTPKAKLVVTMDLESLRRQVGQTGGNGGPSAEADSGPGAGAGATLQGAPVPASSIRRIACDAEIIPLVLGGPSEIVDQGRAKRLVTPGQRLRLSARDGGCTIPGCSMSSSWCDAHHVVPWAHGGRSDITNYALLCPRHHTFVHEHDLTATVTGLGVRWHLR